ncbi:MAG TPA: hypothetical protein DCW90_22085, partial [Lachnospiraceae bacterium]|nr:hypothetical protein [Lachnospiraceae bacterium]
MKKFYRYVVDHPKLIITIFGVLFVLCFFGKNLVSVNYDINDYLPKGSPSTVALDRLETEYEGGIPNARIMLRSVTIPEALSYKQKLLAIDGVKDVTWLDTAQDITEPLEMMDQDTVETYYKNDNALLSVTIDEEKNIQAVEEIRTLIGEDNEMSGSAVATVVATTSTVKEVAFISIVAVLFVLAILLLTTQSFAEPIIILIGLGIAVVINNGTNLLFGQISFVTNAAGSILQLAVSLDYSVF